MPKLYKKDEAKKTPEPDMSKQKERIAAMGKRVRELVTKSDKPATEKPVEKNIASGIDSEKKVGVQAPSTNEDVAGAFKRKLQRKAPTQEPANVHDNIRRYLTFVNRYGNR